MKITRLQFEYRDSASHLHKAVGDCLRASKIFSGYSIYQEYPVCRVNPNYIDSSTHFDWVIPDIFVVIECHGIQHYEVQTFGGNLEEAILLFQSQRRRDKEKKEAAIEAGYTYIEIPYTLMDKITDTYLLDLINDHRNDAAVQSVIHKDPKELEFKEQQKKKYREYLTSEKHKKELEEQRQYKKQQYRKNKELKNNDKSRHEDE